MAPVTVAFLAVIFVVLPFLSSRTHRSGLLIVAPRESIYISAVVTQWIVLGLLLGVLWLEERAGLSPTLSGPLGPRQTALWTAAVMLGAGVVVGAVWLLRRLSGLAESAAVRHLLPRNGRERLLFVLVVAPTAGFVEEALYRGYAISRLEPVVGDPWLAAGIACVAFSLGHVYQGRIGLMRAGTVGMVLAAPYVMTGSLLPSMIAHAAIDALSALLPQPFLDDSLDPDATDS